MRPLTHLVSRVAAGVAALAIAHAAHAPAASAESCAPPRQLGVVFVLDDSGSMAQSDAGALRATGAGAGLRELGAGSVAAAVSFSSDAQPIFGPTVLDSGNAGPLTDLIAASLTSSGGTDFDPAFAEAKPQLDAMPASVDRKAVILLSDGDPNVGYDEVEPIAAAGIRSTPSGSAHERARCSDDEPRGARPRCLHRSDQAIPSAPRQSGRSIKPLLDPHRGAAPPRPLADGPPPRRPTWSALRGSVELASATAAAWTCNRRGSSLPRPCG